MDSFNDLNKIAKQNKHEYFTSVHVSEPQVTRVHRTSVYSNRRLVQSLGGLRGGTKRWQCMWVCTCVSVRTAPLRSAQRRALRGVAVNNLGTLFWLYAVVVVQDQTSGALAARHAGLEAVALYHPQWHVGVKAGFGARRSALVEHKAPLHRTAHSWGRQPERRKKTQSGSETGRGGRKKNRFT